MEEDIKMLEKLCNQIIDEDDPDMFEILSPYEIAQAIKNLLTSYKEYDNLLGEIDNKEVSDALHMLLHCSLKDTEYETQKEQFQIVNAYIKQLEEENNNLKTAALKNDDYYKEVCNKNKELENNCKKYVVRDRLSEYVENTILKSLVKEKIEELKEIADEDNQDEYIKIQVLQDLLERSREDEQM